MSIYEQQASNERHITFYQSLLMETEYTNPRFKEILDILTECEKDRENIAVAIRKGAMV